MSQTDLARATGLCQMTIWRLESGVNPPSPATIRLLAAALTGGNTEALVAAMEGDSGDASGAHAAQPSTEAAP